MHFRIADMVVAQHSKSALDGPRLSWPTGACKARRLGALYDSGNDYLWLRTLSPAFPFQLCILEYLLH